MLRLLQEEFNVRGVSTHPWPQGQLWGLLEESPELPSTSGPKAL